MKDLAVEISKLVFDRLEPELHVAMTQRIIEISLEKWRFRWRNDAEITAIIEKAVSEMLDDRYRNVVKYIADKKAREKILRKAEQNGIPQEEILPLFGKIENDESLGDRNDH